MNRGVDYDWNSTNVLPEKSFQCGFCGEKMTSKDGYIGWMNVLGSQLRHYIYLCHLCGQPNFFNGSDSQTPSFQEMPGTFPPSITAISSRFVEVHKQAQLAESQGWKEIAGPGYRKALEILIKDYLIHGLPNEDYVMRVEQEKKIKETWLKDCIQTYVENTKIKALAEKAAILGNDETHYEKRYEGADINDLKKLIGATVAWIELDTYTAEALGA